MRAFVEQLCEHAGVVRCGPEAEKYGDPFDFAVAYQIQGEDAVVKALVAPQRLTAAHVRAILRVIRGLGFIPIWERHK